MEGAGTTVLGESRPTRARWPWLVCALAVVTLVAAIWLALQNGLDPDDPWFLPVSGVMILGYTTVGALLTSRNPGNPIGPLMMVVGLAFAIGGVSSEYMAYTYVTQPGSLPFGAAAALLSNPVYLVVFASLVLLILLFPTGRVVGPRWRFLPRVIVASSAVAFVCQLLVPGRLEELDLPDRIRIVNPIGVEGLGPVFRAISGATWVLVVGSTIPAILSLVLRYRRALGEERQQIRWLAYLAGTFLAVVLVGILTSMFVGPSFGSSLVGTLFFAAGISAVGIGVPLAVGVAVLQYRLYDLDLVIKKTVVFGILVVLLLAAALIAVVVGSSVADFSTDTASVVIGTALGVSVVPLYRVARRIADRVVYGGRADPYEVLTEFSDRIAETYSADDVLPRTAAVLGTGIGAEAVRVWLQVGSRSRLAASWPSDLPVAESPTGDEAAFEVRHQGEVLGAITVAMPASDPMNPSKERLVRDLAAQEGLVLRNVRLIEELRESRRRIVAAQDERAKALERNIHDGAQQQLVALAVKLRLLEQVAERDPEKARALALELQTQTNETLEDLRDLARGIYPPLLADQGLRAALEAQARKSTVPVTLDADGIGRFGPDVESAVYFSCLEALQNVAKYAKANAVTIRLDDGAGVLRFEVTDDGVGFDPSATGYGTGLQGIADRLAALGGDVRVTSTSGTGTAVTGSVPSQVTP